MNQCQVMNNTIKGYTCKQIGNSILSTSLVGIKNKINRKNQLSYQSNLFKHNSKYSTIVSQNNSYNTNTYNENIRKNNNRNVDINISNVSHSIVKKFQCNIAQINNSQWQYYSTESCSNNNNTEQIKDKKNSSKKKSILPLFKSLYNESAVFSVDPSKIEIILEPSKYYKTIKNQILQAKHRVVLTALYIGIDQVDLVQTIYKALEKCPSLRVTILLDCLRGTRASKSGESSVTLVAPLLTAFPDRVEIALYHTPELTKPLKILLPQRVNEILGLFHAKIAVFDDNIILAGANLSTDYFVNRQDRYVFFKQATSLSDYFYDLAFTMTKISYQLAPHHTLIPSGPDPTTNPRQFRKTAFHTLDTFLSNWYARTQPLRDQLNEYSISQNASSTTTTTTTTTSTTTTTTTSTTTTTTTSSNNQNNAIENQNQNQNQNQKQKQNQKSKIKKNNQLSKETDTIVIPMLQMRQLHIQENERLMKIIMNIIDSHPDYWKNLFITSGYLNFTNEFKKLLVKLHSDVNILCAAPQANSFYKNPGLSGYIPVVYTYFERQIHDEASNKKGLKIHEYVRPGWTYHAKGLWASYIDEETGKSLPNLTILGSTNFGRRSLKRDVEAQVLMITDNKKLQLEMAKEVENLLNYTVIVDKNTFQEQERQIPLRVILSTKLFQSMF